MRTIVCKNCGKEFTLSDDGEKWYLSQHYQFPKYCKQCKEKRTEMFKAKEKSSTIELPINSNGDVDFKSYMAKLSDKDIPVKNEPTVKNAKKG